MIYKLTADNVNSINEKISKYGNIIRIRIFCLQDNDIDLSLLNKLELQFSDLELNVYIDSDKSLKGLNKIDGTIDLNIYGTDKQKIDLSDLNNIRFLQIRSCTIDDKSGWGNMTNIDAFLLAISELVKLLQTANHYCRGVIWRNGIAKLGCYVTIA